MRAAHATLFFDLVLSSMLVVVVLLSMQRFSARSSADDDGRWEPPQFALVMPRVMRGSCSVSYVGEPGSTTLPDTEQMERFARARLLQVPLIAQSTAQLGCETSLPTVEFVVPAARGMASSWNCNTDSNGRAILNIRQDATTDTLTYGCEFGVRAEPPPSSSTPAIPARGRHPFPQELPPAD
jgi:hypothetical protein